MDRDFSISRQPRSRGHRGRIRGRQDGRMICEPRLVNVKSAIACYASIEQENKEFPYRRRHICGADITVILGACFGAA